MKKVCVFLTMDDEQLVDIAFRGIHHYELDKDTQITFATLVQEYNYPFLKVFTFPKADYAPNFRSNLEALIRKYSKLHNVDVSDAKATCLFSDDIKVESIRFLAAENFDLAVGATKDKSGLENLFISSFVENIIRHSPCDVLVMR